MNCKKVSGFWGWAGIALWVAAWDLHSQTETMSHFFAPRGKRRNRALVVLWIYISMHLLRWIPDRLDPLRKTDKRKGY